MSDRRPVADAQEAPRSDGAGPRTLVIVGAGGFSREAAVAARACAAAGSNLRLAGFVDDADHLVGASVDGVPVLGRIDDVRSLDALIVVGIGRPDDYAARMRVVQRLALPVHRYATIVHPDASLGGATSIGPGTIALANVVATANVLIGKHVALMPDVVLTHDVVIDDFATLASGVRLGGGARVATGAYLGASSTIREGVTIGAWSMVGMGSLVTRDIPPGELWFGSPARYRRPAPVSPETAERVP